MVFGIIKTSIWMQSTEAECLKNLVIEKCEYFNEHEKDDTRRFIKLRPRMVEDSFIVANFKGVEETVFFTEEELNLCNSKNGK